MFDPLTQTFVQLTPLADRRFRFAAVAAGAAGDLYVFGGQRPLQKSPSGDAPFHPVIATIDVLHHGPGIKPPFVPCPQLFHKNLSSSPRRCAQAQRCHHRIHWSRPKMMGLRCNSSWVATPLNASLFFSPSSARIRQTTSSLVQASSWS